MITQIIGEPEKMEQINVGETSMVEILKSATPRKIQDISANDMSMNSYAISLFDYNENAALNLT